MNVRQLLLGLVVVGVLVVPAVLFYRWQMKRNTDQLIAQHIQQLAGIFDRINKTCGIIGFEHQQNYIDFLNVKSFSGSEIGPMNLMYPDKWEGPYLDDKLTMQEQYYQVVRTNKGYFIVPGSGVVLGNGKVIGKDIIFDEAADIEVMLNDDAMLRSQGRPLAARIKTRNDAELSGNAEEALSLLNQF